ncbi:MAG TPA: hypothetical protein DCY55_06750 [Gammaproteobacteria bacterium]|nr:hypothetical protein [Gammaproteobacteria bacterium]
MGLLAPLIAFGAVLAALPFFLHRLNTATPDQQEFASAMLLAPTQKREHVRKKLRYLILMIMRILLLLAIVFAFARPFMDKESVPLYSEGAVNHLVVIDTSASMGGSDKLENAKQAAKDIVRAFKPGDQAQLLLADNQLRSVVSPSTERNALLAAIDDIEVSRYRLDYGVMMSALSTRFPDEWFDHKIHLFSDLQQSGMPRQFAKLVPELPANANVELVFYPQRSEAPANWLVEFIDTDGEQVRVGIKGYQSEQQSRSIALVVNDEEVAEQSIDVSPSGRAIAIFDGVQFKPEINRVRASLLQPDALEVDNQFNYAVDRSSPEPVPLITVNPYARSVTYMSTALRTVGAPGNSQTASNWTVEPVMVDSFDPRTLERYNWVLVDDIGAIPKSLEDELARFLQSGGAVFAAAGERTLGLTQIPLSGHSVPNDIDTSLAIAQKEFLGVSRVESSHPILDGLIGWVDVSISQYLSLEANASDRVLAWTSNGQPLLIEQRIGRGRLIVLTTSLDNEWNNIPVKPLFVGLMGQAANYLSQREAVTIQKLAGDYLRDDELSAVGGLQSEQNTAGQIIDPFGETLVELGTASNLSQRQLNHTGFYELHNAGGQSLVGVNIAPAESDTTFLSDEDLKQWESSVSGQATTIGSVSSESSGGLENDDTPIIELWRILAMLALFLLIAESLLSTFYLRRAQLLESHGASA